ncbi:MAG TPA: nucleoside-diphosphate kinase [Verrucomicrobiae bacterium]|nr:nucleoside-diphosphate kinase [Verrucomicrobiae bacterium]
MTSAKEELAYVLINPYTIYKSRTGGVIARLFTRTALELVAARMFAPSRELVEQYAKIVVSPKDPQDRKIQEWIRQYILDNYSPDPKTKQRRRVMMLVFRGEDAVRKVRQVVGSFSPDKGTSGETIRDTYGDFIVGADGQAKYFEPAVLAAPSPEEAEIKLKLWAEHSDSDGGFLEKVVPYPKAAKVEQTLVLLKPDNFRFPSARPGNIVDMLSRTGLYIIAIKVHHMSVAQAEEFYGPVRAVLQEKLKDVSGQRARLALEKEFGFGLNPQAEKGLGDVMGPIFADEQFSQIVQFMTGRRPEDCSGPAKAQPGLEKILAVIYEGPDAVNKIRGVLGPTDPRKAPPGTIRREMGKDIMVNAAHASDSAENAQREMRIINIRENNLKPLVEEFYNCKL